MATPGTDYMIANYSSSSLLTRGGAMKFSKKRLGRVQTMKPTLKELRIVDVMRDYKTMRSRWFQERVPVIGCVGFIFGPDKEMDGCLGYANFIAGQGLACIVLHEKLDDAQILTTLLHEMCHLSVERQFKRPMGHGKHWQNEMKRIAKLGAFGNCW